MSSFMSLYSLNTLFTETNSLRLIDESIKALEVMTSMVFANNAILSCFFLFFLIIDYTF